VRFIWWLVSPDVNDRSHFFATPAAARLAALFALGDGSVATTGAVEAVSAAVARGFDRCDRLTDMERDELHMLELPLGTRQSWNWTM
jgi:hypothetical protein